MATLRPVIDKILKTIPVLQAQDLLTLSLKIFKQPIEKAIEVIRSDLMDDISDSLDLIAATNMRR